MKVYRALCIMSVMLSVLVCSLALAEDTTVSTTDPKAAVAASKAALQDQKQEIKANATDAKVKEKNLRTQLQEAVAIGDKEKAASLRKDLKATHAANVKQRRGDIKGLKDSQKKVRQEAREARKSKNAK